MDASTQQVNDAGRWPAAHAGGTTTIPPQRDARTYLSALIVRQTGVPIALPASAVIAVHELPVRPPYHSTAPWLGGWATLGHGQVAVSLRLVRDRRRQVCETQRGVLIQAGRHLRCLVEVDQVVGPADIASTARSIDGCGVPEGWLVAAQDATRSTVLQLVPAAVARSLDPDHG